MPHIDYLAAGAVLMSLLLLVGHYFNWTRPLSRIQRYVFGVTSILAGFATWRLLDGDWQTPAGLAILSLTAGAVVALAYWWDGVARDIRATQKYKSTDDEA